MIPKVVQVVPGEQYQVYIYFEDGHIKLYDMRELINKGGVFEPLKDRETFQNRMTVLNDTLAWDLDGNRDPSACVDLDPICLYEKGTDVQDPLKQVL